MTRQNMCLNNIHTSAKAASVSFLCFFGIPNGSRKNSNSLPADTKNSNDESTLHGAAVKNNLVIPINPELNPPEKIEDLQELIDAMQLKADNISVQIEHYQARLIQQKPIDEDNYKKCSFALKGTNRSIGKLQKILRDRKDADPSFFKNRTLPQKFLEMAKHDLDEGTYKSIMEKAKVAASAKG